MLEILITLFGGLWIGWLFSEFYKLWQSCRRGPLVVKHDSRTMGYKNLWRNKQ